MKVLDRVLNGSCAETGESLSDHLEGELGGLRKRRVLRHLERCERCRAVLASLERALEHLRALGRIEAAPRPALADAVLQRIQAEERSLG